MTRQIRNSKLKFYLNSIYKEESEIFSNIEKSIKNNSLRAINIDNHEGRILKMILGLANAKKVIEVGTLAGYSTAWIAEAIGSEGKIYSFESDKKAFQVASNNLSKIDKPERVQIILGDAHTEINSKKIKAEAPYDAIFIDAEKRGYPKYLDWAEENIKENGLIIADNTFLGGAVYDEKMQTEKNTKQVDAIKEFNLRLADERKYESVIIPTEEGLTIAKLKPSV